MNCVEFQRVLPEGELGEKEYQSEHLRSCSQCAELVADLNVITRSARELPALEPSPQLWTRISASFRQEQAELDYVAFEASQLGDEYEPSPRVWNSLEIALRQEGLIHPGTSESVGVPRYRWFPWLVPAAAALALLFGVMLPGNPGIAKQPRFNRDDQEVVNAAVATNPAMRPVYETGLADANKYIQDAQQSVEQNPDNDELQQSLMDAYEQKQVVYELASNRSMQ